MKMLRSILLSALALLIVQPGVLFVPPVAAAARPDTSPQKKSKKKVKQRKFKKLKVLKGRHGKHKGKPA